MLRTLAQRCFPAFSSRGLHNPIKVHVRSFQTTSRKMSHWSGNSEVRFIRSSLPVRNGQLHFQVRGDGPHAILCIPGALGTALTDFLPQLEYFRREGSVFTIVGMDPLGYGVSRPQNAIFLLSQTARTFSKLTPWTSTPS